MSTLRRVGAGGIVAAIVAALVAAIPAGAQQSDTVVTVPEAFVASAAARGLHINLLGNDISIGASNVLIDSTPKASAKGAGVLLVPGTVAEATATAVNQTLTPPKACVLNLPLLGVLTATAACGEARVTTEGGLPQAAATGSVATVDIGGSLLTPLLDAVGALAGQTIGTVVPQLTTLLGGLLNQLLPALGLNLNSLVDQLVDGLKRVTGLLSIAAGPSASSATTTSAKVNSTGIAEGAVVNLLPGLTLTGAPLASIKVGDARASVDLTRPTASQSDPVAAVATPSFQAALVEVDLGLPLLGGNVTSIPVGLGSPLTLLAGTPLESTIALGGGTTGDGPNGSKFAVADGVSLQLLKGINGGITIQLAHAEASGGGLSAKVSVQSRVQTPVPAPQPELAKTGGEPGWIPMLGAVFLLGAYGTRRLARAGARTGRPRSVGP